MWASGLLDEVRGLIAQGLERGVTASRAIGYAQAVAQLRGELSQNDAIEQTKRLTRRYARRQVSWFKRYPELEWLDASGLDASGLDVSGLDVSELEASTLAAAELDGSAAAEATRSSTREGLTAAALDRLAR